MKATSEILKVKRAKRHTLCQGNKQSATYGGPEVTFSHSDFYEVNEIVFKPLLFDFGS